MAMKPWRGKIRPPLTSGGDRKLRYIHCSIDGMRGEGVDAPDNVSIGCGFQHRFPTDPNSIVRTAVVRFKMFYVKSVPEEAN